MTAPRSFLSLVTAAAAEPQILSLADVRLHCRIDQEVENTLLTGLLQSARSAVEHCVGRAFLAQRWRLTLDRFPVAGAPIELSKPPFAASPALTIQYRDSAGVLQTWSSSEYIIASPAGPTAVRAYVVPAAGYDYPVPQERPDAVIVEFSCGVDTAEELPPEYRTAMLLLVGHWYENREAVVAGGMSELPIGVQVLLAPYEVVSLV